MWQRLCYNVHDAAAIRLRSWWSYYDVTMLPLPFESTAMLLRKFWANQNSRHEVAIMKIPIHFYYDLGPSTTLLPFMLRSASFWPKFRIVAESPSSGMGVLNEWYEYFAQRRLSCSQSGQAQTSMSSYRDYLQKWNFGPRFYGYRI